MLVSKPRLIRLTEYALPALEMNDDLVGILWRCYAIYAAALL